MTAWDLVPKDLLPFIENPPLLKGESYEAYIDLLTTVFADFEPEDHVERLWLIRVVNYEWEILRNMRFRAHLINLYSKQALAKVIATANPQMKSDDVNREVQSCEEDPARLVQFGTRPEAVCAMATSLAESNLEYFDKAIDRLQRNAKSIIQSIEARREIHAHRDRERERRFEERERARALEEHRTGQFAKSQNIIRNEKARTEERRKEDERRKNQKDLKRKLLFKPSNAAIENVPYLENDPAKSTTGLAKDNITSEKN